VATATLRGAARRRVIVGVVGPIFSDLDDCDPILTCDFVLDEDEAVLDHASNDILTQAEQVAVTLTDLQHIVLTTGTLFSPEVSVRYHALRAAERSGRPHAVARFIGIVPREISALIPVDWAILEKVESDSESALFLHTMLSGAEHDRVIAAAADVLIALPGGQETSGAVAAAIGNMRPVVFLNSLEELADPARRELAAQNYGSNMFPASPLVALDPETAVEAALRAVLFDSAQPDLRSALRHPDFLSQWPRQVMTEPRLVTRLQRDTQLLLGGTRRRGLTWR
jgi:hypothetical protein